VEQKLPQVINEERESWSYAKATLLKEQNGASLKPETHTPSFALDFPVVVIDEMTEVNIHNNRHVQ